MANYLNIFLKPNNMGLITILLFFVYIYGLGFSITFFVKESENLLERIIIRIGVGLGTIPILGVIINFIHIPIDWKLFLIISLPIPIYLSLKKIKNKQYPSIKITKSNMYVAAAIILFLFSFFMYAKGAFNYPYLEDDDSWGHALTAKYIALEKTAYEPDKGEDYFYYTDPYPPGYDIIMAILYQTSQSMIWTLKFFTSLMVSLATIFIYFFVKSFTKNRKRALFAAFALAMIPCFATHFIWSLALSIVLFFPLMYCIIKIKEDKKWIVPAIVVLASINVTQPTMGIKINIMVFLYFITKSLLEKKIDFRVLSAQALGGLLSLIWWVFAYKSLLDINIRSNLSKAIGPVAGNIFMRAWLMLRKRFPPGSGTATREYGFSDFFIAKKQGLINNPVGVGLVLSVIIAVAIIYLLIRYKTLLKDKNHWKMITLVWLLFTFLGINSLTFNLPFGLFAFRFWMLFAIPASIIASEGFFILTKTAKPGVYRILIIILILTGITATSGIQKYSINTAIWNPGGSWDYLPDQPLDEVNGYLWLLSLPYDTKVFPLPGGHSTANVIAMDKYMCAWCKEEKEFYVNGINKSIDDIYNFLKSREYKYAIVDPRYRMVLLENRTYQEIPISMVNDKIQELINSDKFEPVHSTLSTVVFRVK